MLAYAEACTDQTTIKDPIQLRLRYIRRLLQPVANELLSFARLNPLAKRKRNSSELSISPKRRRYIFPTTSKVVEASQSITGTHIRALVDAVACPKAISDLKLISESIRKYSDRNRTQVAMDVYTNAEAASSVAGE